MFLSTHPTQSPIDIPINGINIPTQDKVTLLGVTIDSKLKFNTHISNICSKAEYKKLLQQANALPLSYERQISILVEVFKTVNKMNPSFMHDVFKLHECQYEIKRRNKSQMVVPKYNTVTYGYNSLAVHGSLLWNFVSQKVKSKTNVKEFQAALIQNTNPYLCSCFNCRLFH